MSHGLPGTGARAFAAAGALTIGLYFGVLLPVSQAPTHPITALVNIACAAPLVAFLALLAAAPAHLQRVLRRWTAIDLSDAGHVAAAVTIAATLYVVIGLGGLVGGAFAIESARLGQNDVVSGPVNGEALFVGLAINIIVLTLPPLFYVAYVHGGRPSVALGQLGLRADGAPKAALIGTASALALLAVLVGVSLWMHRIPIDVPDNELALAIGRAVTPLGALGLAAGAAVSEEVFFRGFLQPRVGLWAQAALFGLVHLSYANTWQFLATVLLGLAFGALYRRTGNLAAPIAAHFVWNFLVLLAVGMAPP